MGTLLVSWRGIENITVQSEDDLSAFESAVSGGLTNVSVAGIDTNSLCSGELLYVTFEEVHRSHSIYANSVCIEYYHSANVVYGENHLETHQ